MLILNNKIDFAVILCVKNANPNGDPLNGNRPRYNYDYIGEISDVCIKRKIRNRLMQLEYQIFVQSDDNKVDEYKSLRERAEKELSKKTIENEEIFKKEACEKWFDVRAFGQVFAYKGDGKNGKKNKNKVHSEEEKNEEKNAVSVGIRGPVTVHSAFSVAPISISSIQITKSVSGEGDGKKKASDTMGMKHRVEHGIYVFYGSINPQLASKTGFSDEDAEAIKKVLPSLFLNDASSARPEGSMEVHKVFWWKHNSKNGQYSSAKVHRSLQISVKTGVDEPKDISDYEIKLQSLTDLTPEVIEGL